MGSGLGRLGEVYLYVSVCGRDFTMHACDPKVNIVHIFDLRRVMLFFLCIHTNSFYLWVILFTHTDAE